MYPAEYLKKKAIADAIVSTAFGITRSLKDLPSGRKRPFRKDYNRRPRKNAKTGLAIAKFAVAVGLGASRIASISAQPIPKFKPGGLN